jgi:hypothetical protein
LVTAWVRAAATVTVCLGVVTGAIAQTTWPERPIRILISFPPGGSTDVIGRILQPGLEKRLGQTVIIENRPGAGGMLATAAIAKSTPDGYTLGLSGAGALAGNVALGEKMSYDPRKDLAPITALGGSPFMLAAAPSFSDASVGGVIAAVERGGEKLSIGHGGNGTLMHLTAQMFNQMAGTRVPLVPYKGTAAVVTDLLGGHVALGIVDPPAAGAAFEADKNQDGRDFVGETFPAAQGRPDLRGAGPQGLRCLWLVRHGRARRHAARSDRAAQCGDRRGAEESGCGRALPVGRLRTDAPDARGISGLHPARDRQVDEGGGGCLEVSSFG